MRPQNRSKSYNCTEHTVVNETGISRKECVSTRGDLTDETMETYTFRSRSKKVNREKSAEAIVPPYRGKGRTNECQKAMATKSRFKNRQLHIEDYLGMASTELKEYPEVFDYRRIVGKDDAVVNYWQDHLLELITRKDNLNAAMKQVIRNKGACGVDGMKVNELAPYLQLHEDELIRQIQSGAYKPSPVRRVEIPKEEPGKVRKLGIPTVLDRFVQQAVAQVLTPIYEEQFSDNSFGFRPHRGAHDALRRCLKNADEGYGYVVSMDLASYFDTVSHSKLIEVLSRTIKDGRVVSLIHKFLNAGVMTEFGIEDTVTGVPQGGCISPLLGNIMLNELDKELQRRGHRFVRYADDCIIFCKSEKSANRTLKNIVPFITDKLFLKVNLDKTTVAPITKIKYLGYGFYRFKGKCRLRLHPKALRKVKGKLKELTCRANRWSNPQREARLRRFVRGWVSYFRLADMRKILSDLDSWLRRRIRAIYWKQWKKVRTRYRNLRALKVTGDYLHMMANSRKGPWRMAQVLNSALTTSILLGLGYPSLLNEYDKVHVNV